MAWRGEVNKNIESSWAASVMFFAKKALLDAGWELMAASKGGLYSGSVGRGALIASSVGEPGLDGAGSGGGGGAWSGTVANRRASGKGGNGVVIIRYPTSSNIVATGGTETDITISGSAFKIHSFVSSGNFEVTSGSGDVEYLIVGGGGSGGLYGGGSGGGVQQGTASVSANTYPIVVGLGGASVPGGSGNTPGNNGNPSSAFNITASGGAGGLGQYSSTTNLGPGGDGAGSNGSGGRGGDGLVVSITGENFSYAAGGGSASGLSTVPPGFGGWVGVMSGSVVLSDSSPIEDTVLAQIADCNTENAWFKIREPNQGGLRREFVFLKGAGSNQLLIKYSRAGIFSLGSASACSTADDGVVISSTTGDDSTAVNSSSAETFNTAVNSSNKINVVTSDTPVFGVFPFYIWTYRSVTGNCDSIIAHEGVLPGTTSELDQDATYRVLGSGTADLLFLSQDSGNIGDYWEAYGLPNAVHRRGFLGYTTAWGTNDSGSASSNVDAFIASQNASRVFPPVSVLGLSPYSGSVVTAPTLVGIAGQFPKGFSTGITFSGFTAQNVLDTFNLDSSSPKIIAHYPGAREAIFLPWVTGIIPQI